MELPKKGDIVSCEEFRGFITKFVNEPDYTQVWLVKFGETWEDYFYWRIKSEIMSGGSGRHLVKDNNGYWTLKLKVGECPIWLEWNKEVRD